MLRHTTLLCLLAAMLLLSGCGGAPAPTAAPTATTAPQPAQFQPTAVPPTVAPTDTPLRPTNTSAPPTNTPVPPTDTPVPPTNTPVPPTNTAAPTNTPAPSNTPAPAVAVKSATLNVRSGPGSNYGVVAAAKQGDTLAVVGQIDNCAWFKVTTPQGSAGWVNGGADYVTANVACKAVPAAEAPPAPVQPSPIATGAAKAPPPTTAAPQPAGPAPTEEGSLPSDKTCILFQNFLGAELNITLTGPTTENFKIPAMGEHITCINPGHYSYTLDAPPPWGATGGTFDAVAGEHFRFPIEGRP